MLTLKDLSKRFGWSDKQTRRYWEAVSPLLSEFTHRGPHNTILLSPQALAVFDRLQELLRQGISLPTAAVKLREELNGSGQSQVELSGNGGEAPSPSDPWEELVAVLKDQLREKDKQIAELLAQLRERDEQIKALMPGPKADSRSRGDHLSSNPSRWQALKYALLGR
jgi:vacuolar-type H+-ATPase subunit I/STV1